MKRYLTFLLVVFVALFALTGCLDEEIETVPKEENLPTLTPLNGSVLKKTHVIEDFEFITTYTTGDYDLNRWRITDSKVINMTASVKNAPKGTIILIEHVHIDLSLKSTLPQLDGLTQDSMDDSFHGYSQDGFLVSDKYQYQNQFAIEGFSKDLIEGWGFVCGDYGASGFSSYRLTEKNLVENGNVYANKMQVVYDILIKYPSEEYFHVVSILDEFLIPTTYTDSSASTSNQS